ncbi:MAG: phenylalanine--tRNA ligase subunit alpha [Patescibacteria group bacterium]|nr:phenylalanine--tRNA ligase subunit alpha [Candidatus Beckwithbacteria bacterium]MDZ4229259.1 phenylalanine--tRNA ligase subunit alpha [Patescibacteria group bacterium]
MQLLNLKNQALALIDQAGSPEELKQLQIDLLGRKSELNQTLKTLAKLPPEEKINLGRQVNETKNAIESALNERRQQLGGRTDQWLDVTAPGKQPPLGHLHPISQAIEEIQRLFEHLGFTRVRYPEVDWDWYVFEALNMPADHPARDEWETIFIDAPKHPKLGQMVLTTHTSNGQVREMERVKTPPIRMLNIGKCYRRQQDPTHTVMFHQFEGLVIDKGISIPHLKGTLDYFGREFFGPKIKSRIRPFHFQFTEPSFEVDFTCTACSGRGCRFCKSGWVEVGGAGMVHPNVLKAGKIDPRVFSGFAFGWGVERVLRLKPGLNIDDIRMLYSSQPEFLNQF